MTSASLGLELSLKSRPRLWLIRGLRSEIESEGEAEVVSEPEPAFALDLSKGFCFQLGGRRGQEATQVDEKRGEEPI